MKHLFKFFFLFLIFPSSLISYAQNLVSNPSFETYSVCPNAADEVYKATGWNAFRESPDYFNSCSSIFATVPSNQQGYQLPSFGNGYCGFWTYAFNALYREIIGSQLSTPLLIGQKYFVSFEVVLSDNSGYGACATDKIGAKFSTIPFSFANPTLINNSAQVYTASIISDTINWTKISGSFIADSSYNYIMLGNFFDDSNTDTTQIYGAFNCFSYYFVENICVSTDSLYSVTWTSNNEIRNNNNLLVFPNPISNGICYVKSMEKIYSIEIYDLVGKKINANISNDNDLYSIYIRNNDNGVYFIKITTDKNQHTQKVVLTN